VELATSRIWKGSVSLPLLELYSRRTSSPIQEMGRGRVLGHFRELNGRCGVGPPLEREMSHGLSPLLKWARRRWLSGGIGFAASRAGEEAWTVLPLGAGG